MIINSTQGGNTYCDMFRIMTASSIPEIKPYFGAQETQVSNHRHKITLECKDKYEIITKAEVDKVLENSIKTITNRESTNWLDYAST